MAKPKKTSCVAASHVVRETFDGMPIVDAEADFTLMIVTDDIVAAAGHEKDATNCILAKACARQVGASRVAFFRRTAYLDLPNSRGERRLVRYKLDDDAAAIVAAFDRGKFVRGQVTVTLKAPLPSQRLDRVLQKSRRRREVVRKSLLNGTILKTKKNPSLAAHKTNVMDIDVRNGTGLVHNVIKNG